MAFVLPVGLDFRLKKREKVKYFMSFWYKLGVHFSCQLVDPWRGCNPKIIRILFTSQQLQGPKHMSYR